MLSRCVSMMIIAFLTSGAAIAGPLVVFIPAEFPESCAVILENNAPFCPPGVSRPAPEFCSQNLDYLHFVAAELGIANCVERSGLGLPSPEYGSDLVFLVDDRNLSPELQSLLEPVLRQVRGGILVQKTHDKFRNQRSTIIRDSWFIGESICPDNPAEYCLGDRISNPEYFVDTGSGDISDGGGGGGSDDEPLRAIATERGYIVFNRRAFRQEIVDYAWQNNYQPNLDVLHRRHLAPDESSRRYSDLPLSEEGREDDTYWEIPIFQVMGVYREAIDNLRDGIEEEFANLPDLTDDHEVWMDAKPSFVPIDVWETMVNYREAESRTFLNSVSPPHRFEGRSLPAGTDIISVLHKGHIYIYKNAIEDIDTLRQLAGIIQQSNLQHLTGESSPQAAVRWLAISNRELNEWMFNKVVGEGLSPPIALHSFQTLQHWKTAETIVTAFGAVMPGRVPGGMPDPPVQELAREIEVVFSAWDYVFDKLSIYDAAERAIDPDAPRLPE